MVERVWLRNFEVFRRFCCRILDGCVLHPLFVFPSEKRGDEKRIYRSAEEQTTRVDECGNKIVLRDFREEFENEPPLRRVYDSVLLSGVWNFKFIIDGFGNKNNKYLKEW